MSISPINSQVYAQTPLRNITKPAAGTPVNRQAEKPNEPELKITIQFNEQRGIAKISTILENTFDSNMWYTIRKDGSGESMGAWGRGVKYPEGVFDETYKAIEEAYKDGKTPDEETVKAIHTSCKQAEDRAIKSCKVYPISAR